MRIDALEIILSNASACHLRRRTSSTNDHFDAKYTPIFVALAAGLITQSLASFCHR